jgi:putative CRISPR-associated protein (TIGR02619 family)
MTTILTTTGISLYLNAKREFNTEAPIDEQMRQYLRMKPKAASAETNSLEQIAQSGDSLVFLHTETLEAKRCAALLQAYFSNRGFKSVRLVELQFQDDERHMETHGLRSLVNTLIDEVESAKRKNQEVVINATSGFKPEIGYSTIIGMLYQIPVKYIHERFRRVVTINPIALDWDTSLFLTYDSFFRWIDAEPRQEKDVEERLKGIPDRESIKALLTIPDANGDIFLAPMGEVLRRRFTHETEEADREGWPESAEVDSDEEKIQTSLRNVKHHYPKGTLAACYKIAQLPYVETIISGEFEDTTLSRIKRRYDDGTILLLWADNKKAVKLIVHTTARGYPQTLKVANQIKELLEID